MWKQKLCLAVSSDIKASPLEQIKMFAEAGFDGFFTGWKHGVDLKPAAQAARSTGMYYQSVHAPFNKTDDMWSEDDPELAKIALNELLECVEVCSELEVPVMVSHAVIGFDNHTPTEIGLVRYGRLIDRAGELGVKIAFENTEGEEYLAALLNNFTQSHVGFCWDSGHEMCYNHSKDMLALYGDRLFATHLNDNLGIRNYDGEITFLDDLHLLPFDGIADWKYNARRLDGCGFDGPLTFELNVESKPGRHDNDKYMNMTAEEYVAEAFNRACRVAALRKQN